MPEKYLRQLSSIGADVIVKDFISNGEVGIGIWNITEDDFSVIEQVTGRDQTSYDSLADFIQQIASPRDLNMVLMEFEQYMKNPASTYRSSFRLKGDKREPKWVLLKGKKMVNPKTGNEIFYIIIHDVSGKKLETGKDLKTNLVNHSFFQKKLDVALAVMKPSEKAAVIRLGMNNYKNIKDKYGFQVVDALVRETATRLNNLFPEHTELGRFSNDTFMGIVPNYQNKQTLKKLTDAIIQVFKEPFFLENQVIRVKISLGVTTFTNHETTVDEILLHAEYATQKAREQGDYITTFFNEELAERLQREIIIENELPSAIEEEAFHVVYQPQINIHTGRVFGVEALTRWHHPRLGVIPPDVFIPMAEKQGVMVELGRLILEKSIQTAKGWEEKGLDFGNLSINVSPVELLHPEFLPHLLKICKQYDFSPKKVELEITEGIYLESIGSSDKIIEDLHSHEFCLAVDDFGTGYSNMSFISQSKLDTVKIDKSMIDQLESETGYMIMESIVNVARKLNYHVIAEGVETEEQVRLLKRINCKNVQGYFYSRPLSPSEMEAFIEERS